MSAQPDMTMEEAIAAVQKRHPRIRAGTWSASWLPDEKRPEWSCWWVTNHQGRKNGARHWTVDADGVEEQS